MKTRLFPFLFLLITIGSCSKNDDSNNENQHEDDTIVVDEAAPAIKANGFLDVIETFTEVSVEIEDESSVSTKILHNGIELVTSAEKQFNVTINPYEIEIGATEFVITSVDEFGNETSRTFSVEIKHLLSIYDVTEGRKVFNNSKWVFVNSGDGQQLAVKQLVLGVNKIYTDEIVEEEEAMFTEVIYEDGSSSSDFDNKQMTLHTTRMPLGILKPGFNTSNITEPGYEIEVKLNGVPFENSSSGYDAKGYNYGITEVSGDDQQTTLSIKHESDSPILIRTNALASRNPFFDGKKENYKYTVISPKANETELQIEANELVRAEDNIQLTLPETDQGDISFYRKGYIKTQDFENNEYFDVYNVSNFDKTKQLDYIDLPVLPMFEYYVNEINYRKNGLVYYSKGSDDNLDINMPNWQASVNETDLGYEIIANNPEVDLYALYLEKIESEGNKFNVKSWYIETFEEGEDYMSFPKLEIPEEIKEQMTDNFFKTFSNFELTAISATDYEAYDSYFEIINKNVSFDYFPYTDVEKYRMLLFPLVSQEGKSTLQRFSWERYSSFKNR
ncbi:hypothetical protein J8L85_13095 [Maribacter sp. MMG018]|uniref:hypothetical protein n=1 Tax=Maribacter sp. MMG018 TaxID=2822688 RepID=UPI001B35A013|nr:hypothetical protein [Maribacter sp. MMG018]MBQ4915383.1 hypothetical protein [Maribacter sp. MMG018]